MNGYLAGVRSEERALRWAPAHQPSEWKDTTMYDYMEERCIVAAKRELEERYGWDVLGDENECVFARNDTELHIVKVSYVMHEKGKSHRTVVDATAPTWREDESEKMLMTALEFTVYPPDSAHFDSMHFNIVASDRAYTRVSLNELVVRTPAIDRADEMVCALD